MPESYLIWWRKKVTQVQEDQRVPNKFDPKRPTPRHIIKMSRLKDKEGILRAARAWQVYIYKGAAIRLASDYSTETFQARREWHQILKVVKSKDLQPRTYFTHQSYHLNWRRNTELPRQEKANGVCNNKLVLQNVKGFALRRRRKREREKKRKVV